MFTTKECEGCVTRLVIVLYKTKERIQKSAKSLIIESHSIFIYVKKQLRSKSSLFSGCLGFLNHEKALSKREDPLLLFVSTCVVLGELLWELEGGCSSVCWLGEVEVEVKFGFEFESEFPFFFRY